MIEIILLLEGSFKHDHIQVHETTLYPIFKNGNLGGELTFLISNVIESHFTKWSNALSLMYSF